MRKLRLSKWDKAGIGVALLLFAGLTGFRAYIAGDISPHYCPIHKVRMRRVWISYVPSHLPDPMIIKFGLPELSYDCMAFGIGNSVKEAGSFYRYCPQCLSESVCDKP